MNWLKRITLIFLLLSATSCAMAPAEPPATGISLAEPIQPSPTATASLSPTHTATASPTGTPPPAGPASRTPRPTNTWVPTQAVTPRNTPIPLAPRPNPTWTPLALPELVWAADWAAVRELPAGKAAWSPVANDLFLIGCDDEMSLDLAMSFYLAQAPSFTLASYETPGFSCGTYHGYTNIDWRPDGQDVFFNALPIEDPGREFYDLGYWAPAYSAYYFLHLTDGTIQQFLDIHWMPAIGGWMNNQTVVYLDYFGGGHRHLTIQHLLSGDVLARSFLYGHFVDFVNKDFVVATTGDFYAGSSAVALGLEPVRPTPDPEPPYEWLGTNLRMLAGDIDIQSWTSYSQLEDWISESNQMLVLQWPSGTRWPEDPLRETAISALYSWSLNTDTLTLLVPNAIYGRISPLRHHLAYLTPGAAAPDLHLVDRITGTTRLTTAVYAEFRYQTLDVHTSFAPDDSYLTYFDTNGNLVLYSLSEQTIHATLPANFTPPIWSPDSRFFVYEDPVAGLSVLEVATGRSLPLATNGATRLSNPQWSHDGAYLALTIDIPNHTHHTAIITLPPPPP